MIHRNLCKDGLSLVKGFSKTFSYKHRIKDSEELESYLTEKIALIIQKYEPNRGIPFKCYAIKSLNGYALNFIRDHGRTIKIPRKFSDLYLKYSALKKRSANYRLTIEDAARELGVDQIQLSKAVEAADLHFTDINDFTEFCSDSESDNAAINYIRNLDIETRELLEEIFLDGRKKHRAFFNRGISPGRGNKIIEEVIAEIRSLRE